jgi:allantoin racemase
MIFIRWLRRMRKIAFLVGDSGPLSPEIRRRRKILMTAATSKSKIDMYGSKRSMESVEKDKGISRGWSIESTYDEYLSVPQYIQSAVEAEQEGYDAVILSCGTDPGLEAVREAVNIPVIGPGTSAMHVCSLICHRFCRLASHRPHRQRIGILSFEAHNGLMKWVSTRDIGMTVLEVRKKPGETFEACVRHGKIAIKEDAVDAITYSCMSIAFLDFDLGLSEALGVPVVNPAKAAVRMAELCIDFGLKHSKLSYPTPKNLRL